MGARPKVILASVMKILLEVGLGRVGAGDRRFLQWLEELHPSLVLGPFVRGTTRRFKIPVCAAPRAGSRRSGHHLAGSGLLATQSVCSEKPCTTPACSAGVTSHASCLPSTGFSSKPAPWNAHRPDPSARGQVRHTASRMDPKDSLCGMRYLPPTAGPVEANATGTPYENQSQSLKSRCSQGRNPRLPEAHRKRTTALAARD